MEVLAQRVVKLAGTLMSVVKKIAESHIRILLKTRKSTLGSLIALIRRQLCHIVKSCVILE